MSDRQLTLPESIARVNAWSQGQEDQHNPPNDQSQGPRYVQQRINVSSAPNVRDNRQAELPHRAPNSAPYRIQLTQSQNQNPAQQINSESGIADLRMEDIYNQPGIVLTTNLIDWIAQKIKFQLTKDKTNAFKTQLKLCKRKLQLQTLTTMRQNGEIPRSWQKINPPPQYNPEEQQKFRVKSTELNNTHMDLEINIKKHEIEVNEVALKTLFDTWKQRLVNTLNSEEALLHLSNDELTELNEQLHQYDSFYHISLSETCSSAVHKAQKDEVKRKQKIDKIRERQEKINQMSTKEFITNEITRQMSNLKLKSNSNTINKNENLQNKKQSLKNKGNNQNNQGGTEINQNVVLKIKIKTQKLPRQKSLLKTQEENKEEDFSTINEIVKCTYQLN